MRFQAPTTSSKLAETWQGAVILWLSKSARLAGLICSHFINHHKRCYQRGTHCKKCLDYILLRVDLIVWAEPQPFSELHRQRDVPKIESLVDYGLERPPIWDGEATWNRGIGSPAKCATECLTIRSLTLTFILLHRSFAAGCTTDLDCTLSGDCVDGQCLCRQPWTGDDCGVLKVRILRPA